jgi:hypothetical protein
MDIFLELLTIFFWKLFDEFEIAFKDLYALMRYVFGKVILGYGSICWN